MTTWYAVFNDDKDSFHVDCSMGLIEIVQCKELIIRGSHVQQGCGLMVICNDARTSKNVMIFLGACCNGNVDPEGVRFCFYEECCNVTELRFVFMLPETISIDDAIEFIKIRFEASVKC